MKTIKATLGDDCPARSRVSQNTYSEVALFDCLLQEYCSTSSVLFVIILRVVHSERRVQPSLASVVQCSLKYGTELDKVKG